MTKPGDEDRIERVLGLTDKLFRAMLPTVPREVLDMDITMPQLKMLLMLFIYGPMRMSAIAADLGITLATATGLVDRLVEREMVTRDNDPDDRRVVLCRLSDTGQQAVSRIWFTARNRMADILRAMPEKLDILVDILDTMLTNAKKAFPHIPGGKDDAGGN